MWKSTTRSSELLTRLIGIGLVLFLLSNVNVIGATHPNTPVQDADGTTVPWQVTGAGGGHGTTTGYILSGTVGQTAVLKGTDGDRQLAQGFWQSFDPFLCGDFDGNGIVNIADAVAITSYVFFSGPPPALMVTADADCNGTVNISDVAYLVAFIFGAGPAPCANCN
jgi:hypothetical protein